ncbi:hypothetical protein GF314_12935 [bacterium]|nr:hypothetical protein [bacterium]
MTPDEIRDHDGDECPETELRDAQLRSLGMMLAGFAHELNTPLGVIASACDSLGRCHARLAELARKTTLETSDVEELRAVLRSIQSGEPLLETGLERAQALVRELRLAARPDLDQPDEPVALVDVLEGDLVLLQPLLRQGITVERRFDARPTVRGRAAMLGQVFFNLMRNAAQAMQEDGGTITVSVTEVDDQASVTVADTGPGVPAAVLDRLFREEVTTKCPDTGTGLGLFLSRKVLERHCGTISAENRPEGGAVFTVTLPLA